LVITQGYEKFIGNAGLCMALLRTQVADLTVILKMPIVLKLFCFSNDILVVYATTTSNTA
jgi:hypothetical protein